MYVCVCMLSRSGQGRLEVVGRKAQSPAARGPKPQRPGEEDTGIDGPQHEEQSQSGERHWAADTCIHTLYTYIIYLHYAGISYSSCTSH